MLLSTHYVEKPWGVACLPAPFDIPVVGGPVGEIWFEPPPLFHKLLIKHIFTSEKLSVQVHPNDAQTRAIGLGAQGKEECWLVTAAEQGAKLGIGFREEVSADVMRRAALDGSIEELLVWHSVVAGDFFYIPANTVHAIGAGVSLIEIQQNSDITYRLYDYGRPRELHLAEAVLVARGDVYDRQLWSRHLDRDRSMVLSDGPYFRLDYIAGCPDVASLARFGQQAVAIMPLDGTACFAGKTLTSGSCAVVPDIGSVVFNPASNYLVTQPFHDL